MNTIDSIITTLETIILECETKESPLGYFAALYLKVTRKVKAGILAGDFADGPRMERLDVTFAQRYIDAYYAHQQGAPVTESWRAAFLLADSYWPIVLQHLLIGMNAHINLDLGVAAAAVMKEKNIQDLHPDFNRINTILASLVQEVQQELAVVWPTLHWILHRSKQIDNVLTDFSMEMARDDAWRFAVKLAAAPAEEWSVTITQRDAEVFRLACLVSDPGWLMSLVMKVIRLGERGTVQEKIRQLNRRVSRGINV
jgi:hypothetical protein